MNLNRIVFKVENSTYGTRKIEAFNRLVSYLEELLFHFLPSELNCGGCEKLIIEFYIDYPKEDVHVENETFKVFRPVKKEFVDGFFNEELEIQIDILLDYLNSSLDILQSSHCNIDRKIFDEAILATKKKLESGGLTLNSLRILLSTKYV